MSPPPFTTLQRAPVAALLLLVLAGCAPAPAPVAPAPAPIASAPAPPPSAPTLTPDALACNALAVPLGDLDWLTGFVNLAESNHSRPSQPDLLAAKLTADAELSRAVTSPDISPEMLRSVASVGDLFAALAGKARALAEATADKRDAQPALADLIEAIKAGTAVGQSLQNRCGPKQQVKQVSGRLPPEVIQKIVRSSFKVFRTCYEDGLRKDPNLEGLATIRFVIARDGSVSHVSDAERPPPSPFDLVPTEKKSAPPLPEEVSKCVVEGFKRLSFPAPHGGIVTVSYPIKFSPGG